MQVGIAVLAGVDARAICKRGAIPGPAGETADPQQALA
jgi:hypothetical protein